MKNLYFTLLGFLSVCLSPTYLQAQIPNGTLEQWVTDVDGNVNPVGWETSNNSPDVSVEPDSPACEGQKAMKVKASSVAGFGIPGFAALGFHSTARPTSLHMCLKATV